MVSTPLNITKYVNKRGRSLERRKSIRENTVAYPNLSNVKSKDIYKYRTETFLRECLSYKDALSLMETMYMDNQFDILENTVNATINNIIPTVESSELPNCIEAISNSVIGDINRDRLIEAATNYKSIDRIIKNHKTLSKRFRIDSLKGKSEKDRIHTVCEMVCTYGRSKYINFNIALEEAAYIESVNNFKTGDMCEDRMVKYISDYFLEFDNNTDKDIDNYRKAIRESKIISNNAACLIPYLMEGTVENGTWFDKLNEWKVNPHKKLSTLIELARENYSDIGAFNEIIGTAKDFARINEMDFNMKSVFKDFKNPLDKNQAYNIISIIKENHIKNTDDLVSNLRSIWEAEVNDDSYYADGNTIPQTFTSDDIDKFKMHNLIIDSKEAGDFIDHSINTTAKEVNVLGINKIITSGDNEDINESNMINYIDNDGYISMKLRSYFYNGNPDVLHKVVESTAKCANNILYNRNSIVYYSIGENYFDFSIRSKYKVVLSEAQESKKSFTKSNKRLVCDIARYNEAMESINNSRIYEIINTLNNDRSYAANVTVAEASLIYEIMNPYIDKNNNVFDRFLDNCYYEGNPDYNKIKEAFSTISDESFNLLEDHTARINLCAVVIGLNEDATIIPNVAKKAVSNVKKAVGIKDKNNKAEDNKSSAIDNSSNTKKPNNLKDNSSKDNDEDDNKDTKNNSSDDEDDESYGRSVKSLNDAKLALKGIKAKGKELSAKEAEASRDLDMEFNHLLKSIKSLYTTDHTEEIITGEVNHSISKIIKIGIGLTGAGIASGSIVVPAIGAVTLFVLSKHATKKDRQAVLDQIDVELQVLDREISRAESSGSAKKYRQLLLIQKNLQRKRQQIHFGIAKSGNRIPLKSTAGQRERE